LLVTETLLVTEKIKCESNMQHVNVIPYSYRNYLVFCANLHWRATTQSLICEKSLKRI